MKVTNFKYESNNRMVVRDLEPTRTVDNVSTYEVKCIKTGKFIASFDIIGEKDVVSRAPRKKLANIPTPPVEKAIK